MLHHLLKQTKNDFLKNTFLKKKVKKENDCFFKKILYTVSLENIFFTQVKLLLLKNILLKLN